MSTMPFDIMSREDRASDERSARPKHRVLIMGARFAAARESDVVREIMDAATDNRGCWVITANLDHLRRYRRERSARQLISDADLVVADGTPLIWASRLAGSPLPERVAGSNLIWKVCEAASHHRRSVFLLGGDPGAAERAAQVLRERYPGLVLAGTLCPERGFEKDKEALDYIQWHLKEAEPNIVLVGLGFPKQDFLIRYLRDGLPYASFVGVGISLSFVAGQVSRAPSWTHKLGLEWSYRLFQEPGRLTRRYILQGLPFALQLFTSAARHRLTKKNIGTYWGTEIRG